MTSGLPFADPPDATPGGDGSLVLVAKTTLFDLAGRKVFGDSDNGSFVGPTLRLTPGITCSLHDARDELRPSVLPVLSRRQEPAVEAAFLVDGFASFSVNSWFIALMGTP